MWGRAATIPNAVANTIPMATKTRVRCGVPTSLLGANMAVRPAMTAVRPAAMWIAITAVSIAARPSGRIGLWW